MRTIGLVYTLFFGLLLADQLSSEVIPAADEVAVPLTVAPDALSSATAMSRLAI
jgi:hypothetical protein